MSINKRIHEMIDNAKNCILECRGDNDRPFLTYDGIISDSDKQPEILYLLKEPNDGRNRNNIHNFDNEFDFTEVTTAEAYKQNGLRPIHWTNLCYWTKAFQDIQAGESHFFLHNSVQTCGGCLEDIALVNIKKVPGAGTAKENANALWNTVRNDTCKNLIIDEIELIKPRIVVCCGTYTYAKEIFNETMSAMLDCGVEYFYHKKILFVEFIHPTQYGAAAKSSMSYSYAKEVFFNIKNKGLLI